MNGTRPFPFSQPGQVFSPVGILFTFTNCPKYILAYTDVLPIPVLLYLALTPEDIQRGHIASRTLCFKTLSVAMNF